MSRAATAVDRTAGIAVGLVLILVGAGAIIWNSNWFNGIPEYITAPGMALSVRSWWWPWAVTAAGIVLVLLGLRWLAAHALATRAHTMPLTGSGENGIMTADLGSVANAAARRLELDPSVQSAKATAFLDRGRRIVEITATAASAADLSAAAAAADKVCCEAVTMLDDDSVATRTRIRLKTANRVRRLK
jgi:hypothetical protein